MIMPKMKELYEKVAADNALQVKFAEIMRDAENAGTETTKEKLTVFAKEMGYDVTLEEFQEFFKGLAESKDGELSDAELDQVAGGKASFGIMGSIVSFGIGCAFVSVAAEILQDGCGNILSKDIALV